jgi:Domain of unknown function (DUF4352)
MLRKRTYILPAAVAGAIALAGCGTTSISTTPTPKSAAVPKEAQTTQTQAKVGDSITLSGTDLSEKMSVTVLAVADPLVVGDYDTADAGTHFVGVEIKLTNVGTAAYSDSPSNGAVLLDNTQQQAQTAMVTGGPAGNDFQSEASITPGGSQVGWLPFQVTNGRTPAMFQFTLDSGMADQTGQWSLTSSS